MLSRLASTALLVSVFSGYVYINNWERDPYASKARERAVGEAIATMNAAQPSDLTSCEITGVSTDPASDHHGAKGPALQVDYNVSMGKAAQKNPYLRNGGLEVDQNRVEIQWVQQLAINHTLEDGEKIAEPIVPVADADESDGNRSVIIPIDTANSGTRTVEPRIDVDLIHVDGYAERMLPGREDFAVSCGKITLQVSRNPRAKDPIVITRVNR